MNCECMHARMKQWRFRSLLCLSSLNHGTTPRYRVLLCLATVAVWKRFFPMPTGYACAAYAQTHVNLAAHLALGIATDDAVTEHACDLVACAALRCTALRVHDKSSLSRRLHRVRSLVGHLPPSVLTQFRHPHFLNRPVPVRLISRTKFRQHQVRYLFAMSLGGPPQAGGLPSQIHSRMA